MQAFEFNQSGLIIITKKHEKIKKQSIQEI